MAEKTLEDFFKKEEARSLYSKNLSQFAYILSRLSVIGNQNLLIICENEKIQEELENNLSFFLNKVYAFPSLSTLAYSRSNPPAENIAQRIRTLFASRSRKGVYIATLKSLIEPVIPPDVLEESYIYLISGEDYPFDELRKTLLKLGYQKVENVEIPGEYSVKGGLVDIFSPYYDLPLRIEFFGDNVESIRFFDPLTQRSVSKAMEAYILPARDFIYKEIYKNSALDFVKLYADEKGIEKKIRDVISEKIKQEVYFGGIEYLLPQLYGKKTFLLDYLENSKIVTFYLEDYDSMAKKITQQIGEAFEEAVMEGFFAVSPEDLFNLNGLQLIKEKTALKVTAFKNEETFYFDLDDNSDLVNKRVLAEKEKEKHPVQLLIDNIADYRSSFKIVIILRSITQKEKIKELLNIYDVKNVLDISDLRELDGLELGTIGLIKGKLSKGFKSYSEKIWFITEEEIFGSGEPKKDRKQKVLSSYISSIYELKEGDLAVHVDYGIGVFRGLKQVEVLGKTGEFIELEYAEEGKLFIPVDKINLIQKYIASEDYVAKIDRLGDKKWQAKKSKAKQDLRKWAEEIIRLEAIRKSHQGYAFKINKLNFEEFSASFEYEETEDQKRAIDEVLEDMASEKPMDRIICGDVGFGKTEVAIRAAFVAIDNGKQVALIAPTTILAEQHYQVFRNRFEPIKCSVGRLSRFVDEKEQKVTLEKLKNGEIDLIIGTHRLLSKDVIFKDLGLLIIDEEHKFGVAQKEKLKNFRTTIDVLTLTATPIPRTLNMALSSIRDISIIASPPEGRLAIKTYVTRFSPEIIKEACEREIQRGGQVFFVHNRISSIFTIKEYLRKLMPHFRIEVGHGRMEEEQLKDIFDRFKRGDFQILLSTAIIESGLDLPNVNTIIVNRADKFGLAYLYQLRGRVGRSSRRAFAYFLVPSFELISKDAMKRLQALQELEELGSGFRLAVHDLEIRGAGELLGVKQSGRINEIGLELYMQLLDEAIRELRYESGEEIKLKKVETEIKLPLPAYIPESYISSTRERLEFYKKIFAVSNARELINLEEELRDRYGKIPQELRNFIYQKELEIELSALGVESLSYSKDYIIITFDEQYIPPKDVLNSYLKVERQARFVMPNKIYLFMRDREPDLENLKKILQLFIQSVKIKR